MTRDVKLRVVKERRKLREERMEREGIGKERDEEGVGEKRNNIIFDMILVHAGQHEDLHFSATLQMNICNDPKTLKRQIQSNNI